MYTFHFITLDVNLSEESLTGSYPVYMSFNQNSFILHVVRLSSRLKAWFLVIIKKLLIMLEVCEFKANI